VYAFALNRSFSAWRPAGSSSTAGAAASRNSARNAPDDPSVVTALLSQRNFQLLWGGQFISDVGGRLSTIALPAAVMVLLGATPMQSAALQAR
jgi:hypothetical protein